MSAFKNIQFIQKDHERIHKELMYPSSTMYLVKCGAHFPWLRVHFACSKRRSDFDKIPNIFWYCMSAFEKIHRTFGQVLQCPNALSWYAPSWFKMLHHDSDCSTLILNAQVTHNSLHRDLCILEALETTKFFCFSYENSL